jgi:hypothetical protein
MATQRVSPPELTSEKPVSARKLEANRKNALKSTGPRTLRGKVCSRNNALKVGLFAKNLLNYRGTLFDNPQEFQELLERLQQQYQPVGVAEELEVERIAECWWRLLRAWQYENAEIVVAKCETSTRVAKASLDEMTPENQTLTIWLETAEKEIETSGEISEELKEKLFALGASFRELWEKFEEICTQHHDRFLRREVSSPLLRARRRANPELRVKREMALGTVQIARLFIGLEEKQITESVINLAWDQHAIPKSEALDRILRSEAHSDRQLNHAIDRLDRLQRRRKGEPGFPPVSVHLTQ